MYKKLRNTFIAIGHIVNDLEPYEHLGGAVSYAAVAAHRLGYEAHIITKCPPYHPYVQKLTKLGIIMHVLPTKSSVITSFSNTYERGRRIQYCSQQQEEITLRDLSLLSPDLLRKALVVVAPVVGEVDPELFPYLARHGTLAVLPQGYFRSIEEGGRIKQRMWDIFEHEAMLKSVNTMILSDEDITIDQVFNERILNLLKTHIPCVVLTRGEKGSSIYTHSGMCAVPSFPLLKEELHDVTGAGDVYAAVFLISKRIYPLREAALHASFYAALKIYGFGKRGIHSVPTKERARSFARSTGSSKISALLSSQS